MKNLRPVIFILKIVGLWVFLNVYTEIIHAQSAAVQGLITDEETGMPLQGANITLEDLTGGILRGMSSDQNGFYQITFPAGEYAFQITYVGYVSYEDTLNLQAGESYTISRELTPIEAQLDDVIVTPPGSGAAGVSAGRQRVEASEFGRVPTPAGGGDLASYLQVIPGIVSTGDRGGQLFIRGGTPAENLILMDGALIFQPFHIVGFFSAFPDYLVSDADIYAGGFGARYSGRTSSVIDVRMRNGSRYNSRGSGSISPFLGEVLVEGPITSGRSSYIASVRRSLVEETSSHFLGEIYPLRFESQYYKLTHFGVRDTRCSLTGLHTYDRGKLDPELDDVVRWRNLVSSGRCVILPVDTDLLFDVNAGISYVSNATGTGNDPELTSSILRANLDFNVTRFLRQVRMNYGAFVHIQPLKYDMSEWMYGPQSDSDHLLSAGGYIEAAFPIGRVNLIPGMVFTFHKETYPPTLDPRFRVSWQPMGRDREQLNAAFGLYHQPVTGIHGTRDASSVFTAWMPSPTGESQMQAIHALLGWQQTIFPGFQISVEGYRKWLYHYPVPVWSHTVQFTTDLASASGNVTGGDIRLEYDYGRFYLFAGYGYSRTTYKTSQEHFFLWFNSPKRTYHPPHDRRHQLNTMFTFHNAGFSASVRWEYGTGLPFNQPSGFDELLSFRWKTPIVKYEHGNHRVLLDEFFQGRLLPYHRLDLSLERTFPVSYGELHLQVGVVNLYNRSNMFYYDVYTNRRVDQLPFAPYLSLKLDVR